MSKEIRIGLIGGGGWMGKAHAMGYRNQVLLFGAEPAMPVLDTLVELDAGQAARLARDYGAARSATDWRSVVADPAIDLVDVVLPNNLHYEVCLAAIEAGKHVYCEKPLTNDAPQARKLAEAAERRGVVTMVGHNFPRNPAHGVARDLIQRGEIGRVVHFRASMHVDFLADPEIPFMWRCDREQAGTGAVGDIATHIFSLIQYLIGDIESLVADMEIVTKTRPLLNDFNYGQQRKATGEAPRKEVTTDDIVTLLCRFEGGSMGTIDVSRVATGRKFAQTYEIYGTKGAVTFDYDNLNRINFYRVGDPPAEQGFKAIDASPDHAWYGAFYPVANFGLGYNEYKAIEVRELMLAVAAGKPSWPSFRDGWRIMQVVDACVASARDRRWVTVG
jgi:predicted dehydrogenase